ncbi:MAG: hypothetical protein OCU22_05895 [Canidatus Methanoxibalbensis ujae]|nr:hypothetical protein [Candidatus Methanoxibalbensis ujae]
MITSICGCEHIASLCTSRAHRIIMHITNEKGGGMRDAGEDKEI